MSKIYLYLVLAILLAAASACQRYNPAVLSPVISSGLSAADEDLIRKAEAEIEAGPSDPARYIKLASLYIKTARISGDFALNRKAESSIKKALELAPHDTNARRLNLSLQATFHRFKDAVEIGNEMLKEFPMDSFIYGILTDANVELGNYDAAVAAAQKMVNLRPNSSSYARVGHIRSLYGDHKGAIEMLTKASLTTDPLDKEARSWCLVFLGKEYFKVGEFDLAEKAIDESLNISPGYLLAKVEKSRIVAARGDNDGAASLLGDDGNQFLSPQAYILRGDIASRQGRSADAGAEYQRAEDAAHNLEGDMHPFALLWADHDVRLDEALDIAEKDFAVNKDIYAADILSWCLYKKERYVEAEAAVNQALRLKTNDARILYHAGMVAKALGNKNSARDYLRSALKANPKFDLLQADNAAIALGSLQ